jgi:hypothetical protein
VWDVATDLAIRDYWMRMFKTCIFRYSNTGIAITIPTQVDNPNPEDKFEVGLKDFAIN